MQPVGLSFTCAFDAPARLVVKDLRRKGFGAPVLKSLW